MAHVEIAYGPPAKPGVTTLLAVGDGLLVEPPPLEQSIREATWIAVGAILFGLATGNRLVRDAGGGAVVALQLAKLWGKR
jgi:hypothetical protein